MQNHTYMGIMRENYHSVSLPPGSVVEYDPRKPAPFLQMQQASAYMAPRRRYLSDFL
jgi:hypothetical protein